ncbi:MAG: hypothetical protein WCJ07_09180 [Verrucomicrobiota bacterium]
MISLPNIKPCLLSAIDLISRSFNQAADEAAKTSSSEPLKNWSFTYDPTQAIFRDQARMVWLATVNRQIPLVWLTQNHSALDTLTNLICLYGDVDTELIAEGMICESSFEGLTWACGKLAASPLRILDVGGFDEFKEIAQSLAAAQTHPYIMCDWRPSEEEVELAKQLSDQSEIAFCWPN